MPPDQQKVYNEGFEAGQIEQRITNLEDGVAHIRENETELFKKLDKLIPAIAELKVKASTWGSVSGLAAALVAIAIAVVAKLM